MFKSQNRWLSFLNTQIKLSEGTVRVKWYRKESSKNILVHAKSAHPIAVKRAVIRNTIKTAVSVCSGEDERLESRILAIHIAQSNGYKNLHSHCRGRNGRRSSSSPIPCARTDKIPLCIPFISDRVSAAINNVSFKPNCKMISR